MVVHAFNPRTWEAKAGGPLWVWDQSAPHSLQNRKANRWKRKPQLTSGHSHKHTLPFPMAAAVSICTAYRRTGPFAPDDWPLHSCSHPPHFLASTLRQSLHTYRFICVCVYPRKQRKNSLPFWISLFPFHPPALAQATNELVTKIQRNMFFPVCWPLHGLYHFLSCLLLK